MRFFTAFILFTVSGMVAAWGWNAMQFAQARAAYLVDTRSAPPLSAWAGFPGLAAEARDVAIRTSLQKVSDDTIRQDVAVDPLLSMHPLSPGNWLTLASQELTFGRPPSEWEHAVVMSSITGPNEGSVMWQRAMLGVLEWEQMSDDARRRTIVDLAGVVAEGGIDDAATSLTRSVLLRKPREIRSAIAHDLAANGLSEVQLAAIGAGRTEQ